jgi:hypothetical protein
VAHDLIGEPGFTSPDHALADQAAHRAALAKIVSMEVALKSRQRRASEFTGAQVLVMFFVFLLLISIPVWTHLLPPLSDYVNHLARMQVIATIDKNPNLAKFYQIDWAIIPNLTMDLVIPWFTKLGVNVYVAGKIFTVTMFAVIGSGVLVLNRVLGGRWSIMPLVVFPLLYNFVFLVGLINYLFGVGVALWALAGWIWLRDRPWPLRFALSALSVGVLFFCHLSALGVYGMGVLAYESMRLWDHRNQRNWKPALAEFVLSGFPFLVAAPLLAASPTMRLVARYEWEPLGKLDGLINVFAVYSDIVTIGMMAVIVAASVWAVRHRLLSFHPFGWWIAGVGMVVYLALPRVLFDSYMADQRVAVPLVYMLIACVNLDMRFRLVRRGFIVLLLLLLAARMIEVDVSWSDLTSTQNELKNSARRIRQGSTVFVAYADRAAGGDVRDLGLVHAPCVAMIDRSALVTTAFTVLGKQVMQVRPEYHDMVDTEDGTPPSTAQLVVAATRPSDDFPAFWHRWTEFDYLYVLFTEDEADNPDPDRLTLLYEGDRFQLYRINKIDKTDKKH